MERVTRITGEEITVGTVLFFETFWDIPEYTAKITVIGEFEKAFDEMHEMWTNRAPVTMEFENGQTSPWHIYKERVYYRVL